MKINSDQKGKEPLRTHNCTDGRGEGKRMLGGVGQVVINEASYHRYFQTPTDILHFPVYLGFQVFRIFS